MDAPIDNRCTWERPTLPFRMGFDNPAEVASWRRNVPARGACYLLSDAADRPVLLATCRNLRSSLVNRMQRDEAAGRSKRTDYAAVVRSASWRPAFSRFEADWVHLEQGRILLPGQYAEMIEHRRVWWLHVDSAAAFPRFQVFRRPDGRGGRWFGPYPTRAAARGVVEALEEIAELCRYHEVLVKAPHGVACAYKEMGKCPAPCDGSVSMASYHGQIETAMALLTGGLEAWREERRAAMQQASAELAFERAARIKGELERATELEDEQRRWSGPLEAFRRLALMPGRRKGCVRAFAVLPGRIAFLGEVQRRDRAAQARWLAAQAEAWLAAPMAKLDQAAVERLELAAWHLMRPEDQREGIFLDRAQAGDAEAILEAVKQVSPTKREVSGGAGAASSASAPG